MTDTERWPLIKGAPRVWPGPAKQLQCHFCLGLFSSQDKRRCYCSPECRNAMHRATHRRQPLAEIECLICHRSFTPRQRNQRWCSSNCRKLGHYRRKHGQPLDRLSDGHTDSERERRRAECLRNQRYQREEEMERDALKPRQNHADILNPDELPPETLMELIAEVLELATTYETDE